MMRAVVLFAILTAAQAALVAPVAKSPPLVAKKVQGHVTLSVEQQKTMHSGCVSACRPSPVESKCVTACEAAMYKCIDETGPNETPADTKKCQDGVLKLYQDTKGIEKKEEKKGGAPSPAPAPAKAKMFLQLATRDDEDSGDETSDEDDDFASETVDDEQDEEGASEDESASSDEDEASEDEEASETSEESDEAEGTDESSMEEEEATAGEEEDEGEAESTDEDASDEEDEGSFDDDMDTTGEDEEESFVQTDSSIAVGDLAAGDAASDDAVFGVEKSTEDVVFAVETAEAEDAGAKSEDKDAEQAADTPAIGDETNDVAESFIETGSSWKPEADSSIKLYEHPQGSTFVTPCPVTSLGNPEACTAYFGGKADADKCPQITCPKALGVTMKLTCGGGCCPTCWAPDHVIAVDRHTSIDDAAVVDAAPQAPGTCGGVKCFKLKCAPGFSEGHVNGACCYSCVQGR